MQSGECHGYKLETRFRMNATAIHEQLPHFLLHLKKIEDQIGVSGSGGLDAEDEDVVVFNYR